MEKEEILKQIETLKGTEEFKTLLDNHAKGYFEQNINSKVKEIYDTIDSVIVETIGEKKPDGLKTSEYVKQLAAQKKELESKVKTVPNVEAAIKEKETLWMQKEQVLTKQIEELKQQYNQTTQQVKEQAIKGQIDSYLATKSFNPAYGSTELSELLELRKSKLVQNSKTLDDGKVVFYKDAAKKEPYLDALGNPATVQQVIDANFNTLYQTTPKGGNADGGKKGNDSKIEGEILIIPNVESIKSRAEFEQVFKKAIASKGLAAHSEEYLKISRATREHYKINALPLEN